MKIGILSDTHGKTIFLQRALVKLGKIDALIHLGDHCSDVADLEQSMNIPVVYVKGNCDFYSGAPETVTLPLGGKRFFIAHGHQYQVNFGMDRLIYKGLEAEADVILYGHTHIPEIFFEGNVLVMNPGSPSCPRGVKRKTAGIIHIADGKLIPHIINLEEQRAQPL